MRWSLPAPKRSASGILLDLSPLCLGNAKIPGFCHQKAARFLLGAHFVRDILPGEIITISKDGVSSDKTLCTEIPAHCVLNIFILPAWTAVPLTEFPFTTPPARRSRTGKSLSGRSRSRYRSAGSGIAAAQGYAKESGILSDLCFSKQLRGTYLYQPTQKERELSVRLKLSVLRMR